jgi:hypothetical protein
MESSRFNFSGSADVNVFDSFQTNTGVGFQLIEVEGTPQE